jgi:F0F1-type ATP synthase assembly protein I
MPYEPVDRFPEGPDDEEIAARLQRVREELSQMEGLPELPEDKIPQLAATPNLPKVPDFDERLRDLESRAQAAKDRRESKARTEARRLANDAESHKGLGLGLTVAYAIIGVPLFGILVGYGLDSANGTNMFKGMGALVGSICGIIGAVVILNRQNQKS